MLFPVAFVGITPCNCATEERHMRGGRRIDWTRFCRSHPWENLGRIIFEPAS